MMYRLRALLVLCVLFLSGSIAKAGSLDPALEAELDAAAIGGRVTALVFLEEQAPVAELSRALSAREASRAERHAVIVRALQDAAATQADLLDWLDEALRSGRVEGYTAYWIVNAVVVRAEAEAIRQVAARGDVAAVYRNPIAHLIEPVGERTGASDSRGIGVTPGMRAIRADLVWEELGITGSGRMVANIDTGVDGEHPALDGRWRGNHGHPWQECWLDMRNNNPTPYPQDLSGHGTHVMGTLTGLGAATGDTVGVAWDALWIACNAIGTVGDLDNHILEAFQWLTDPDGDPATIDDVPDVVQNSWGVNEIHGYPVCFDLWWDVIDNCEAAGCVVVFSAGNEGPYPMTLRSPADRDTSPLNCFSVGAVDATNFGWPYPIADFSSRGPSGCPDQNIKPEIAAPGVEVYSSVPGGGYEQTHWDGTSMAGPHVAGIVALMREANPDIEVDVIKQILLDTARDEGEPGEDNDYGWGFPDAYAAVSIALEGTGILAGNVTNATNGGTPIEWATISLVGSAAHYPTDASGDYQGRALGGIYTAVARHPSFAPDSQVISIEAGMVTVQDFSLEDIASPEIWDVSEPRTIPDETGPYPIEAMISDQSTIIWAKLWYRVGGEAWTETEMSPTDFLYCGEIPGQVVGSTVDFYIEASDIGSNVSTFPPDAPDDYRTFFITAPILVDDAEIDRGWTLGWPGDMATEGIWVREDPVGTYLYSRMMQPEDDHTPDPGHICFVTANGDSGAPAGADDVDGGCTSLVSPMLDMSDAQEVFVYYWRWFGRFGPPGDRFSIQVSNNNGFSWTDLEVLEDIENCWTEVFLGLTNFIELTNTMRMRFEVCDLGGDSTVEGAVDDVSIEIFPIDYSSVERPSDVAAGAFVAAPKPNPARATTQIVFRLATPGSARLEIFDASGRRIRRLVDGDLGAGTHEVTWDGRDDRGGPVGAGVYFYRLRSGAYEQSSRVSLMR